MALNNDTSSSSIRTADYVRRVSEASKASEAAKADSAKPAQGADQAPRRARRRGPGAQQRCASRRRGRRRCARRRCSGSFEPGGGRLPRGARPVPESGTLRRGAGDEQSVRDLQTALNQRGANIKVDGRFGNETEKAVRAYQRANGLNVDGAVGNKTKTALSGAAAGSGANPTRPGQTGPTDNEQTPRAPGNDPTLPATKITGGPNRSQFDRELQNPAVRARMAALTVAEVGASNPKAQRALMETIFNRAQATGKTLMQTMNTAYYAPFHNGGGGFRNAQAKVRDDPALQQRLNDGMRDVRAGSNVSNYATDNSSAGVAAAARRSQAITAEIGGETFSRKEGMRNGVRHADYRPWLRDHPRNSPPPAIANMDRA